MAGSLIVRQPESEEEEKDPTSRQSLDALAQWNPAGKRKHYALRDFWNDVCPETAREEDDGNA